MSAYLSWGEAAGLALAGTPVRRDAWTEASPVWLERRPGLWVLTDERHAVVRVVDAEWFTSDEFYGNDWTTDPPGTVRDVCLLNPPRPEFRPPGIGLLGEIEAATIALHADIGESFPAGAYMIRFFLDGTLVGSLEAAAAGRYTVTVAVDPETYLRASRVRVRAWIDVSSSLPLPAWTGHAEWETVLSPATWPWPGYEAVNLAPLFPDLYPAYNVEGWYSGNAAGVTIGPFSGNRWVYSHADDPAAADDELAINGVILFQNDAADPINGGLTTLLHVLPAGQTFRVNVWNGIHLGYCWASGQLRLYSRPI